MIYGRKAVCPNNPAEHKKFVTVAHIMEDWVVDERGDFVEVYDEGEVTDGPDEGNFWTCLECGARAKFEDCDNTTSGGENEDEQKRSGVGSQS